MEAELERYLVQINGQAEELAAARATRQDLEEALRRARADSDHFKKQLTEAHRVAMSQASVAASLVAVMPNNPAQAFRYADITFTMKGIPFIKKRAIVDKLHVFNNNYKMFFNFNF